MATNDDNRCGNGRGRKRGTGYNRRTDAEIARDKRREHERLAARRRDFFMAKPQERPSSVPPTVAVLNTPMDANAQDDHEEPPGKIGGKSEGIRRGFPPPTDDDPLPGVVMSNVPVIFRLKVGKLMSKLRESMQAGSRQANQFFRSNDGVKRFDWTTFEYQWGDPTMLPNPTAADFLAPQFARIIFFAPDRTRPHMLFQGCMPCKWHGFDPAPDGNPCTCRDSFYNNFVRTFDDKDGTAGFFFSSRYYCKIRRAQNSSSGDSGESEDQIGDASDHAYYFAGHDPDVMRFLTDDIRDMLDLVVTKRRAITRAFSDEIFEQAALKSSFLSIRKKAVSHRQNLFYKILKRIDAYRKNKTVQSSLFIMSRVEHEKALKLNVQDVVAEIPLRQYLEKHFLLRALNLLPYYERCLQLVSGRVLCGDKSYKVIRFVFVQGADTTAVRAFDSVYTVMNEYNQVVAINFVRAGDYDEMESILKGIQHRYNIHGYEDVRLFYTDSCCHEYNMLVRAMPTLGDRDPVPPRADQFEQNLPLAQLPVHPVFVTTKGGFLESAVPILEHLDAAVHVVPIGFDIEWDSLSTQSRQEQFPETLQLAVEFGNTTRVLVISLRRTFPEMILREGNVNYTVDVSTWCQYNSTLLRILTHKNSLLVGVGVKGDVTRLKKSFPAEFVGTTHNVGDCVQIAEKASLLFWKQKKRPQRYGCKLPWPSC